MEITPEQLKSRLETDPPVALVDCREPMEWEFGHIDGAMHIPMRQTPARLGDLPNNRTIVVYCHHGIRSLSVVAYLRESGFDDAWSLAGGIDAWATDIDAAIPRY